jgi:hypothetical protein
LGFRPPLLVLNGGNSHGEKKREEMKCSKGHQTQGTGTRVQPDNNQANHRASEDQNHVEDFHRCGHPESEHRDPEPDSKNQSPERLSITG